jgi:hypothetical protein
MSAHIPKRSNLQVVTADNDERIIVDCERNVITRAGNLASMYDKEPTASPNTLQLRAVNQLARIKLARERLVRLTRSNHFCNRCLAFSAHCITDICLFKARIHHWILFWSAANKRSSIFCAMGL